MNASEFDYIIVGAGSAGCVLANRLTQSGKHSVLLLESGGSDNRFWVKVPIGYAINVTNPALNWMYHTAPDPGLNSRSVYWPRGRITGGSSSINAMTYMRGLAHDFDDWQRAGAQGWDWDTVRSVYERMETHSDIAPFIEPFFAQLGRRKHRNTRGKGPVWVSDLSDQMAPFCSRFLDAARQVGVPVVADLNTPGADGLSYYRSTVRNGYRYSSADAFLRSARRRANLCVLNGAQVDQLLANGSSVKGVAFHRDGHHQTVMARREVIVLRLSAICHMWVEACRII